MIHPSEIERAIRLSLGYKTARDETATMDFEPALSDDPLTQLDRYFKAIQSVILARQHPVTGLLPASTAVTVHGDYTDAWVRDNVYSIYAVWGLTLAFQRHAPG
jgi:hypothetical protein